MFVNDSLTGKQLNLLHSAKFPMPRLQDQL